MGGVKVRGQVGEIEDKCFLCAASPPFPVALDVTLHQLSTSVTDLENTSPPASCSSNTNMGAPLLREAISRWLHIQLVTESGLELWPVASQSIVLPIAINSCTLCSWELSCSQTLAFADPSNLKNPFKFHEVWIHSNLSKLTIHFLLVDPDHFLLEGAAVPLLIAKLAAEDRMFARYFESAVTATEWETFIQVTFCWGFQAA